MKKQQAKKFLRQKLDEGYITHSMLLDLYKDDEEIPENFLNLCYSKPSPPPQIIIPIGIDAYEKFGEALMDFQKQKGIKFKNKK